jgi:hypothetical protein
MKNGFKMIFSKKRKTLQVVKRCPLNIGGNEIRIWNDIFTTISRSPGNNVPIVAQKSLLGHSKGGSAAWQMPGTECHYLYHSWKPQQRVCPKVMNVMVLC